MNTYKKQMLMLGITFITFQACHATKEFDDIKFAINRNFKALFEPDQTKFSYIKLKSNKANDRNLENFYVIMDSVSVFVQYNNQGLLWGRSDALDNASKVLVAETKQFTDELRAIRNQLIKNEDIPGKKNTLANSTNNSVTMARAHSIKFNNIKERVQKIKNILAPKQNDYKSTGQKESYALLMEGLNALLAGINIAYDNLDIYRKPSNT